MEMGIFNSDSDQAVVSSFLLLLLLNDVLVLLWLGLLVLLVLGDQVVHVGLRLGELHLIHPLARVPGFHGVCYVCGVGDVFGI